MPNTIIGGIIFYTLYFIIILGIFYELYKILKDHIQKKELKNNE